MLAYKIGIPGVIEKYKTAYDFEEDFKEFIRLARKDINEGKSFADFEKLVLLNNIIKDVNNKNIEILINLMNASAYVKSKKKSDEDFYDRITRYKKRLKNGDRRVISELEEASVTADGPRLLSIYMLLTTALSVNGLNSDAEAAIGRLIKGPVKDMAMKGWNDIYGLKILGDRAASFDDIEALKILFEIAKGNSNGKYAAMYLLTVPIEFLTNRVNLNSPSDSMRAEHKNMLMDLLESLTGIKTGIEIKKESEYYQYLKSYYDSCVIEGKVKAFTENGPVEPTKEDRLSYLNGMVNSCMEDKSVYEAKWLIKNYSINVLKKDSRFADNILSKIDSFDRITETLINNQDALGVPEELILYTAGLSPPANRSIIIPHALKLVLDSAELDLANVFPDDSAWLNERAKTYFLAVWLLVNEDDYIKKAELVQPYDFQSIAKDIMSTTQLMENFDSIASTHFQIGRNDIIREYGKDSQFVGVLAHELGHWIFWLYCDENFEEVGATAELAADLSSYAFFELLGKMESRYQERYKDIQAVLRNYYSNHYNRLFHDDTLKKLWGISESNKSHVAARAFLEGLHKYYDKLKKVYGSNIKVPAFSELFYVTLQYVEAHKNSGKVFENLQQYISEYSQSFIVKNNTGIDINAVDKVLAESKNNNSFIIENNIKDSSEEIVYTVLNIYYGLLKEIKSLKKPGPGLNNTLNTAPLAVILAAAVVFNAPIIAIVGISILLAVKIFTVLKRKAFSNQSAQQAGAFSFSKVKVFIAALLLASLFPGQKAFGQQGVDKNVVSVVLHNSLTDITGLQIDLTLDKAMAEADDTVREAWNENLSLQRFLNSKNTSSEQKMLLANMLFKLSTGQSVEKQAQFINLINPDAIPDQSKTIFFLANLYELVSSGFPQYIDYDKDGLPDLPPGNDFWNLLTNGNPLNFKALIMEICGHKDITTLASSLSRFGLTQEQLKGFEKAMLFIYLFNQNNYYDNMRLALGTYMSFDAAGQIAYKEAVPNIFSSQVKNSMALEFVIGAGITESKTLILLMSKIDESPGPIPCHSRAHQRFPDNTTAY